MSRKPFVVLAVAAAFWFGTVGAGQQAPDSPKPTARLFHGPELVPMAPAAISKVMLVTLEAVQGEIKLTDAQKKQQNKILANGRGRIQKARQTAKSVQPFQSSRDAIWREIETAVDQSLGASQRDRLHQIQLQAQGPRAFERPDVQKQLEMSRDQVDRVTKIVNDGLNEIESASQVPIDLKSKGTEATLEEVEEYVKSPALLAARDASRQRLKDVRASVQKQIADVLNNQQNAAYKTMLGPPFDVAKLVRPGMQRDEHELLVMSIGAVWVWAGSVPTPSSTPRSPGRRTPRCTRQS